MAKAQTLQAGKPAKPAKRRKGGKSSFMLVLLLVGAIMAVEPVVGLVLTFGLAPAVVALFTEMGPFRLVRMRTIFLFNAAGVVPYCAKYWESGDIAAFYAELSDPYLWVVMWGAAVLGYFLLWLSPQVAAAIEQSNNRDKIKRIQKLQRELVEEWGGSVNG